MACRIKTTEEIIKMRDLPGGKLAVIVSEGSDKGKIVVRGHLDSGPVIILGDRCGDHSNNYPHPGENLVRLLEDGEQITV